MTSRKDAIETEAMLNRLQSAGISREDAESLRRISMTLHRWHEMECGDSNDYSSWALVRGAKQPEGFVYDDNGKPFLEVHTLWGRTQYLVISDREAGALKRLATIMARYPALCSYVQGDPRGATLYILRPGDVPEGENADSYYSRGLAVYK